MTLSSILEIAFGLGVLATLWTGAHFLLAWQRHVHARAADQVLLSVRVSRTNERQPIVAEQIFAVLHGVAQELSILDRLRGIVPDSFSFEIAHVDGQIRFYVSAPRHFRDFVESQIYAQYADVEIQEVKDYAAEPPVALLNPKAAERAEAEASADSRELAEVRAELGAPAHFEAVDFFAHALIAELQLSNPEIFPIKRYSQFEDKLNQTIIDPLAGLTSSLSKLPNPNDRAAIQIAIRPMPDTWRKRAEQCAKKLVAGVLAPSLFAKLFLARSPLARLCNWPLRALLQLPGAFRTAEPGEKSGAPEGTGGTSQHDRESPAAASMDKVGKLAFDVSIRLLFVPSVPNPAAAQVKLREMVSAFRQFSLPNINSFEIGTAGGRELLDRFRAREVEHPFVLNTEELATLFHLPNLEVTTPNIYWVTNKKLEPPIDLPTPERIRDLTVLGKTNYRGLEKVFGIKTEDRRRHIYIIGKTGMGKSTLLENMIISDIQEGKGVAVVDPHGDLCEHVLDHIPANRTNDVIVFDPSDRDFPVAFNMLENIDPTMNSVVASGLVGIFKKLYADSWGPRLEHILRNTILSLVEYPGTTMLGIPRMLSDKAYRSQVVRKISDPVVRKFWTDEFEPMQEKQRVEAISPIQNKVGQFLSSSIIRNIVGQPKSMVDLRFAMDNRKIFICNLSKGKIGEDNSSLLGSMIITKFQLDAMSRANIAERDRVDFYLYVDEFQNFATDSFATILSEARKYRLNLTMANQYIAQMSEDVQGAVFGNVGTIMSFQVGYDDAEYISKQYSEVVTPNDLVQLPKYSLYSKLLVDGMPTQPFSAGTMAPLGATVEEGRREKVIKISRERYSRPRAEVEDKINRWSRPIEEKIAASAEKTARLESAEKPALPAAKPQIAAPKPEQKEKPAAESAPKPSPAQPIQISNPAPAKPAESKPAQPQPKPNQPQPGQPAKTANRPAQPKPVNPNPAPKPADKPQTQKPVSNAGQSRPAAHSSQHAPAKPAAQNSNPNPKPAQSKPSQPRPQQPIQNANQVPVRPAAPRPATIPPRAQPAEDEIGLPPELEFTEDDSPAERAAAESFNASLKAAPVKSEIIEPAVSFAAEPAPLQQPEPIPVQAAAPVQPIQNTNPQPAQSQPVAAPIQNTPAQNQAPAEPASGHAYGITPQQYHLAVQYLAHYEAEYKLPREQAWAAAVAAAKQVQFPQAGQGGGQQPSQPAA